MPDRAKKRLESLAKLQDDLDRVKRQAAELTAKISAELEATEERNAAARLKNNAKKGW